MPADRPILQDHHVIEQQTFRNDPLLRVLAKAKLIEKDAFENRLYMPADRELAQAMRISPHSGGPIADYQDGIGFELRRLQFSRDGQEALRGDPAALQRVAAQVKDLRDTMTVGLVNGDLYTNAPLGMRADDIRPVTQSFFLENRSYAQLHASKIGSLASFGPVDRSYLLVTESESRIVALLEHADLTGNKFTKGGNLELQRSGLSLAISNAHHEGRTLLSESSILTVERVLGEEAGHRIRSPRSQQGGATLDLLLGEASTSQLIRSGGLLASGADAVVTAGRTSQLLEEGNGTAAQSELTHALARNGGGWVGGMATASVIGTSSFVPAAIVAGDALLMSKAFDKGADLLDNRAVYRQTDKADVTWQFDGRNWQRQAVMDSTGDGLGNPAERSVGASYEKARELGAYAHVKAVELALGKAPPPQDPFSIPAKDGESRLDNPNWHRDAQTEQWTRQVKIGVSGANDRGVYETQTASPERANELNREAVQRIENNIANGKAAIAASYL